METAPNLRADAFAGTAEAYLRYRPAYPAALLDDLLARAALAPEPVLLDLACGPGRVALALAERFSRVLAVDLEPEMVRVGEAEAARRALRNITWFVGRAETASFPAGVVDMITVGEAFHRLDQAAVLARAQDWLKPGGCFVTLGAGGPLVGGEGWKDLVATLAERWMAKAFPFGWAVAAPGAARTAQDIVAAIERAGFVDVEVHALAVPWEWSIESLLGYLRSTSVCSEHALGQDFPEFERDLRAALAGQGPFREQLEAAYTLARKPHGT